MRKRYKEEYIDIETVLRIYQIDGRINDTGYTSVDDHKTKVKFVCTSCGVDVEKKVGSKQNAAGCNGGFRASGFKQLCTKCLHEQTFLEKYGSKCYFQSQDFISKRKSRKTKSKNNAVKPKQKKTLSQESKDKMKATNRLRYGVDNPAQSDKCKEKYRQTCLEKYGVDNYSKTDEYKEKVRKTNLEKYGAEYYSQTNECKEKVVKTSLLKFNAYNYSQTEESHHYHKSSIMYDDQPFDSIPELEFYKKCIAEGKSVIRHPIKLEYWYGDKTHYYFPDFLVDGQLVEIKGKHFLNPETGKWYNPFNSDLNEREEARYDCAIRNGVRIIYV